MRNDLSASYMWPRNRYAVCELIQGLPCFNSEAEAVRPKVKASGSAWSLVGNAEAVRASGKLGDLACA